jgi:hypothetical protein
MELWNRPGGYGTEFDIGLYLSLGAVFWMRNKMVISVVMETGI